MQMHDSGKKVFDVEALRQPEKVREALKNADFTQENIAALVAIRHPTEGLDIPMVLRRARERTPFHTFVKLFILGQPVEEGEAGAALAPSVFDELLACGLCVKTHGSVRSVVNLSPFGELLCASDFGFAETRASLPPEHVLGVGPASVTLANLTVRAAGGTFFDVACGSGIQALLAASSADRVIASDTSLRALNFAAFNARLNGFTNIEWREGSFFDPAGDEHFETVACNPPFVISPSSRFIFRDGGMSGDGVSEFVVRGMAARLREGAFATSLVNWVHTSDDDWDARPLSWTEGSGCDALVIRSSDTEPVVYAANWLRQSEGRDPEIYEGLLDEWIDYYRQAGIRRICSGVVILRKRAAAKNWRRADIMDAARATGQCGAHIREIFDCEDFLHENASDEDLLRWPFSLSRNLISHQSLAWDGKTWIVDGASVGLSDGLPFAGRVDGPLLRLLSECTGDRPLHEIISELVKDAASEQAEARSALSQVVRKLIRGAMMLPRRG